MLAEDLYAQANDSLTKQNYHEAIRLFKEIIEQYPDYLPSYSGLAKSHFLHDQPSDAIPVIKHYIERIVSEENHKEALASALDLLGQCYSATHNNEALATFAKATKVAPQFASAWHNWGLCLMKNAAEDSQQEQQIKEQFKTAFGYFKNAMRLLPENPLFLHSFACWFELYVEILEKFISDEDELLAEKKKYYLQAEIYYLKALAVQTKDDCNLAFFSPNNNDTFKNVLTSNYCECLVKIGDVYYQEGNLSEAENKYLKCLHYQPKHLDSLKQMGLCRVKVKDGAGAQNYLLQALTIPNQENEDLAITHCNLGCAYTLLEEWEKAREEFAESKKLSPEIDLTEELQELKDAMDKVKENDPQSQQRVFN